MSNVYQQRHVFQSDAGAPLLCSSGDGVWSLHGVLAHEGQCRARPHPDVFGAVAQEKTHTWIRSTIGWQE